MIKFSFGCYSFQNALRLSLLSFIGSHMLDVGGMEDESDTSLQVLGGIIHLQRDLRSIFNLISHKDKGAGSHSRPWVFGINSHIPGTFASWSEGNTQRDLFGWGLIYRTNRVIAGTGWPPKYQSIMWSRHYYKRLVMEGSLF